MTEQQPYEVVEQRAGFEVRRYPEYVIAEVEVRADFADAGNIGFGSLIGYISGRNRGGARVAMTAPVLQEEAGTRIAMTAPVLQEAAGRSHLVSFVMPAGVTRESLPVPADPRVRLRTVPGHLAAVRRFRGTWNERAYEEQVARLLDEVRAAGFEVAGAVRYARFDPPWMPPFLRRNEVVVPVVSA